MTENQVSEYVAEKIRDARKQRGWSTGFLASRCGLTDNMIENIESGRRGHDGQRRRAVTVDELFAIAEAFELRPLQLMPGLFPNKVTDSRREEMLSVIDAERVSAELLLRELTADYEKLRAQRTEVAHNVARLHAMIEELTS